MKLSYSIAGKLWWIHNFLDYDMYKGIHDAIIKERKNIHLHSSKGIWQENLIENIVPPLRTEVSNYKPFERLTTLIKRNPYVRAEENITKTVTIIHFTQKNSGINWHNDVKWKYGASFYLNHRWYQNWGGEFMFNDNNGHGWLPPLGNSLVIVKTPLMHKVNPVLSPTLPRISIQVFMR